jgi:amino acid adenylation domain-containing protein
MLLHHLLLESAARYPDRTAVIDRAEPMTYRELDAASARLSRELIARGAGPGTRVGLYLDKSLHAIVAVWGVLRAGAAYVPLDVASPVKRVARITENGDLRGILAGAKRWSALAPALARPPAFVGLARTVQRSLEFGFAFETLDPSRVAAADSGAGAKACDPSCAAYILYTSGSTGQPKGVVLSHRAALSFVDWAAETTRLGPTDIVSSHAPLHFDLSVFDIFASCLAAACMVVVPENMTVFPSRLAGWIDRERVTLWYSVPSVLTMLAEYGNLRASGLPLLRAVIFAGEVFPAKHLSKLMAELPGPRYLNWYGPTETNVCTWYEVPPGAELTAPVPIGRSCANFDAFAVTADGDRVAKPGQEGELYVRGPGLMSGYWGDAAKTAGVLVANPFQAAYAEAAYRTGDLVTLDEAGDFIFLGRRDGMVKTRGYRVELGEVEAALYAHPAVREAVVLPVPDELLGNRLRAVISAEGSLTREEVLDHCRRRVPGYMVPDVVEFCSALPRTSTGKIDRAGLRGPDIKERDETGGR